MRCTLKRDILFLKGWRRGCWANKYMYIIIIIIVVCYSHLAQFSENHNSLVPSHVLQIVRTYVRDCHGSKAKFELYVGLGICRPYEMEDLSVCQVSYSMTRLLFPMINCRPFPIQSNPIQFNCEPNRPGCSCTIIRSAAPASFACTCMEAC